MTHIATVKQIPALSRSNAMALRRARSGRKLPGRTSGSRPMGEMNVTPFIDVLLVLLIMLIMGIPVAMQNTTVPLPNGKCDDCIVLNDANTVSITANDQLLWNGEAITRSKLSASIAAASAMDEPPLLRFEPSPQASYDVSAKTIALIKQSGGTKMAFGGTAQHRDFGR